MTFYVQSIHVYHTQVSNLQILKVLIGTDCTSMRKSNSPSITVNAVRVIYLNLWLSQVLRNYHQQAMVLEIS